MSILFAWRCRQDEPNDVDRCEMNCWPWMESPLSCIFIVYRKFRTLKRVSQYAVCRACMLIKSLKNKENNSVFCLGLHNLTI